MTLNFIRFFLCRYNFNWMYLGKGFVTAFTAAGFPHLNFWETDSKHVKLCIGEFVHVVFSQISGSQK